MIAVIQNVFDWFFNSCQKSYSSDSGDVQIHPTLFIILNLGISCNELSKRTTEQLSYEAGRSAMKNKEKIQNRTKRRTYKLLERHGDTIL